MFEKFHTKHAESEANVPEENAEENGISRRSFLKGLGASLALAAVGSKTEALQTITLEGGKEDGEQADNNAEKHPIGVHFFFGAHAGKADVERAHELLEKSDVYTPEMVVDSSTLADRFNAVAMGTMTVDQAMEGVMSNFKEYLRGQFEMIEGTKKKVFFLEPTNPIGQMSLVPDGLLNTDGTFIDASDGYRENKDLLFGKVLGKQKVFLEKYAQWQKNRGEYYTEKLEALARAVRDPSEDNIKTFSYDDRRLIEELHKDKRTDIFATWGALHTDIYHAQKKQTGGEDKNVTNVERTMSTRPLVYGHGNEATRRIMFGRQVSNELLAKTLLEREVQDYLDDLTIPFVEERLENTPFIRRVVESFSFDEIKETLPEFIDAYKGGNHALRRLLEQKGIHLPKNRKEFEELTTGKMPIREAVRDAQFTDEPSSA